MHAPAHARHHSRPYDHLSPSRERSPTGRSPTGRSPTGRSPTVGHSDRKDPRQDAPPGRRSQDSPPHKRRITAEQGKSAERSRQSFSFQEGLVVTTPKGREIPFSPAGIADTASVTRLPWFRHMIKAVAQAIKPSSTDQRRDPGMGSPPLKKRKGVGFVVTPPQEKLVSRNPVRRTPSPSPTSAAPPPPVDEFISSSGDSSDSENSFLAPRGEFSPDRGEVAREEVPPRVSVLESYFPSRRESKDTKTVPESSSKIRQEPAIPREDVHRTPSTSRATQTTTLQHLPQGRSFASASRLETIQRLLTERGFSQQVADRMSRHLRESSANVYQAKWKVFCGWCRGRGLSPLDASIPTIAEFLVYLREEMRLSVSAVKGYRSALSLAFRLKGVDISSSLELSLLIRNYELTCPQSEVRPPPWNVVQVLRALKRAPFEPLRQASDRHLTWKTAFLLALASAKRVSELHGLSYDVAHSRGWGEVTFRFVPEFIAKTQNPGVSDPRFDSFKVTSLRSVTNDPDHLLLCPVRSLRRYLKRTAAARPHVQALFVSTGRTKRRVTKNSISSWIRKVISSTLNPDSPPSSRPRAHDVRGVATSLAFKRNFSVTQVLQAGVWKRQTTFTAHYLQDVTHRNLDTFSIGPVVAAQQLV
ncbi:uncharacterized protein [Palaemon carinicauda]|uniref:uncharacterized protein n=1 Tax=Palaemon carinicauda TaxID=392227 RepID=UPI0035B64B0E